MTTGYLYFLDGDELIIKEGRVFHRPGRYFHASFIFENDSYYICHMNPGKVYRAKVWLIEKDDAKARELLIEYHQKCIGELRDKIVGHEQKIDILRGDY